MAFRSSVATGTGSGRRSLSRSQSLIVRSLAGAHPLQPRRSTTYSIDEINARTSSGSIAANVATRS